MKLFAWAKLYIFLFITVGILVPVAVFAYEAAPLASTLQPTFVTEKSIQLNGMVNPNEMADTSQWFEWGIVGRSDVYETRHEHIYAGNWQTSTYASIMGLAPGTQYFFRQIAENGRGRDVGQTGYVTTKPLPSATAPIAVTITNDAVFVEETTATLRGYVSPHGNTETQVWFEWGTTAKLENQTPHRGFGGDSGPFEIKLERLVPGTAYYFRAVAENSAGRSYGGLRVLVTRGTAVVGVSTEAPRDQYVPSPVNSSADTVSRNTTTDGDTSVSGVSSGDSLPGLPQALGGPGDFFSMLFGGKKTAKAPVDDGSNTSTEISAETEVASPAAASDTGFLGMFSGEKPVEVVIERIGGKDSTLHTPIEYRIAYAYRKDARASDTKLKITLPVDVIYIGDNTNNELLIESGKGPSRTYVLPLGNLEKGSTRAVSILGMTTGDAGNATIRAHLEYTDASGTHIVPAESGTMAKGAENTASVGGIAGKVLPSSLVGWLLYILFVVGVVIGVRKLKEYYTKKKELLARDEAHNTQQLSGASFFPGREETTPAVSA